MVQNYTEWNESICPKCSRWENWTMKLSFQYRLQGASVDKPWLPNVFLDTSPMYINIRFLQCIPSPHPCLIGCSHAASSLSMRIDTLTNGNKPHWYAYDWDNLCVSCWGRHLAHGRGQIPLIYISVLGKSIGYLTNGSKRPAKFYPKPEFIFEV